MTGLAAHTESSRQPSYNTFGGKRKGDVSDSKKDSQTQEIVPEVSVLLTSLPESAPLVSSEKTALQRHGPTLLIIVSAILISCSNCCVRYITTRHEISPLFIVFFRGLVQTIGMSSLILTVGRQAIEGRPSWRAATFLFFRGALGAICIIFKYKALERLPVGVGSSLFSTSPLFASIFGWLLLKMGLSMTDGAALLITIAGSVLVGFSGVSAETSSFSLDWAHCEGVVFALLTATIGATIFVLMRWMGTAVHFMLSVLAHSVCSMIVAFCIHFVQNAPLKSTSAYFHDTLFHSSREATLGLFGVAILGIAGSLCLNKGAQLIAPGKGSLLRTLDIPLNFAFAFLFLGEFPASAGQLVGCTLMGFSAYLVATKSSS